MLPLQLCARRGIGKDFRSAAPRRERERLGLALRPSAQGRRTGVLTHEAGGGSTVPLVAEDSVTAFGEVVDYDPAWARRFAEVGGALRARLGQSALRIDHIGSTSVPGLVAKNVIDVQVTVERLSDAGNWPDELLPGLAKRPAITNDHVPAGVTPAPAEWAKQYWSTR